MKGTDRDDTSAGISRRTAVIGALGVGSLAALGYGAYVMRDDGSTDLGANDTESDGPRAGLPGDGAALEDPDPVSTGPTGESRRWLGPELWGNRLQDWRCRDGRIECLAGDAGDEVRTVSLLTRELASGGGSAHVRTTAGLLDDGGGGGFAGFLVGVGAGELDYRAAALVQRGSGEGGGTLCTFETDGRVRFRDHTSERRPLELARLSAATDAGSDGPRPPRPGDEIELALDVLPRGGKRYDLHMRAFDATNGELLARGVRRGVPERAVRGGVSLVSSPYPGESGARWWFENVRTAGSKAAVRPDRTFGPIAGTLYSLAGGTLKLTAQLLPVERGSATVELRYRPADGEDERWRRTTADLKSGYIARFRVENWDATRPWEYRVVYRGGDGGRSAYGGRISREPADADDVVIALFSCVLSAARRLEAGTAPRDTPATPRPGRFTPGNIYFPHDELTKNADEHDPDLLVFGGDQLYEHSPTDPVDDPDPELDYLYKWYMWVWSFRGLTRDTPTVTLVDDHDVYQRNLWGESGRLAPRNNQRLGGYVKTPSFVNTIQRVQCGHNPDPYDPGTVRNGIDTYYARFEYGGVEFALLEDRKFKTSPPEGGGEPESTALLGSRQESLLAEWAREERDAPRICLTQTCFASVQTTPGGKPREDYDTNGYPTAGRDRAVELLRDVGALVLAGDQHLATLVRHGVDGHADGVVQFSGPAGGTLFQRWFEPAGSLPNGRGLPNTGDFTDAFGNEVRVLAVANPKISFSELQAYRDARPGSAAAHNILSRRLKREGYGIVRVDREADEFVVECWPWNADPVADDRQFSGWPYRLPFDDAGGRDGPSAE